MVIHEDIGVHDCPVSCAAKIQIRKELILIGIGYEYVLSFYASLDYMVKGVFEFYSQWAGHDMVNVSWKVGFVKSGDLTPYFLISPGIVPIDKRGYFGG